MQPNGQYTVDDLIADPTFEAWVRQGCPSDEPWGQRLTAQPGLKPAVDQAANFITAMRFGQPPDATQQRAEVWGVLQREIHNNRRLKPLNLYRYWWAAAAAVALLVVVGLWLYTGNTTTKQQLATGYGQQKVFTMADGSKVTLNANSTLTVLPGANPVYLLTGEAYFDLAKSKPGHYKTVRTRGYDIVITGTAFNALNRASRQKLTLVEGQVTVQFTQEVLLAQGKSPVTKSNSLKVEPGFSLTYNADNQQYFYQLSQPNTDQAWLNNQLVVHDLPLAQLAVIIQEQYGQKMLFAADGLAQRKVSGTLPTQSLQDLTSAVATALNLQITQTKKGLVVANKVE